MAERALAVDIPQRSHERTRHAESMRVAPTAGVRPGAVMRRSASSCACDGNCPRCRGEPHKEAASSGRITLGPTDDAYEIEAERAANVITYAPVTTVDRPHMQRTPAVTTSRPSLIAPESVHAALDSPAIPLDATVRANMEDHFGKSFESVRVHADGPAGESARDVDALAYTVGSHVVFAPGEYAPNTNDGRRLIAHELAHVVQQGAATSTVAASAHPFKLQRQKAAGTLEPDPKAIQKRRVFVIGSPSPAEIAAGHPYQFVNAAVSAGVDEDTVWIVERTGYEKGSVGLTVIQKQSAPGKLVWITPEQPLVSILNAMPQGSIGSMQVFSHGLAGLVTLRYGWKEKGLANYGLSLPEVRSLSPEVFTQDARIEFDSCNTGTADWMSMESNLAQTFAEQSGHPVTAWTGRTSYSEVNRAAGSRPAEVQGSEIMRNVPSMPDWAELGSEYFLDRIPKKKIFTPVVGPRVDGFTSTFEISVRLPESRKFKVPEGAGLAVTITDAHFISGDTRKEVGPDAATGTPIIYVSLYKLVEWGTDPNQGLRSFPVNVDTHREVWGSLTGGTYYIEIYRPGNSNFLTVGAISVDVFANPLMK